MGALTDNTIASTYKQLLKITSEGVGADASAKYVEDGLGTDTALSLSTTRIGIGTASPANILHIVHTGGDSNAGIKIISTASDSFNWITEATNSNLAAGEHLVHMFGKEQATKNSAHIGFTFNSDHGDDNTLNLGFFGANDILNVTSGGNVGIGTTSPNRLLRVNAADGEQDNTSVAMFVNLESTSGRSKGVDIQAGTSNDDYMLSMDDQSGNTKFRFTGAGRLGIGQTTVNAMLDIDDDGADTGIGVPQIRVGSINNTGVYGLIGFGWGGSTTYSPVTIGGLGTSGSGSVEADFVINTRDGTSDAVPVERMRVTHDGKVGIGTTSPARILDIQGAGNTDGIRFNNTGYSYYNEICNNGDGLIFRVDPGTSGGSGVDFRWTINDDEKMRLNQGGRLGINATTVNARLHVNEGTSGQENVYLDHTASGLQTMILFKTQGTTRGTIQSDNSPSETHYNTSSDERLKENIVEVDDALSIVNKIPVKQFNFIEDENNTPVIGYIGQELIKEYPRAVSVTKTDEYDDHHMVDQSKMVAVLMKAVQELSAKVETLKLKVEELKTELQDTKDYVDHKQDYNSMAGRINSCEARIASLEKE